MLIAPSAHRQYHKYDIFCSCTSSLTTHLNLEVVGMNFEKCHPKPLGSCLRFEIRVQMIPTISQHMQKIIYVTVNEVKVDESSLNY